MSSIAKVAKRAGVSPTTVSHVLNRPDRVTAHLRERVEEAVRELGYVPNPQAKSLRTGRTNLVAMLIPDIRNPFYPELVREVQVEIAAAGLDLLIFNTDLPGARSGGLAGDCMKQVRARRVDGVIVASFALYGQDDALQGIEVPTVFIGDPVDGAADHVRLDDFGGGYLMGRHLAERGHRRIAHVTGPRNFDEAMARAAGFEQGLRDGGAGVMPELRHEGTYLAPSGSEAVRALFGKGGPQPTALFFANYQMAVAGIAELYDLGADLTRKVEVGLFGDLPQAGFLRPRVATVGRPPQDLARAAVKLLTDRLRGGAPEERCSTLLPCRLHAGDGA